MMANWTGDVLYTGMTNDLERRVWQHKSRSVPGFTQKYDLNKLVYFEQCHDVKATIAREKQIKGWRREKKNNLVNEMNAEWKDLSTGWYEDSSLALGMTADGSK
jgi:putative endonuclease